MRIAFQQDKLWIRVSLNDTTIGCIRKSKVQNRGNIFAPGSFVELTSKELRQIADKMESQVEAEINSGNHEQVAPGMF